MRRLAIAGTAVALPILLAACVGLDSGEPMRGVVVGQGWNYLTEDSEREVYIQSIPIEEPGRKAAYVRYEERENRGTAEEPMLSARTVFEFDCRGGRFRHVNTTYYAAQNLKQSYSPNNAPPKAWVRPEPNSIASKAFEASCGTQVVAQEKASKSR